MKLLQVMAGARHGGAETAFVDMCIAFAQAGHEVEVVTRHHAARVSVLRKAGLKVHCLPFGGRVDIFTPFMMRRIIKSFAPDIVQSWMSRASMFVPRWSAGVGGKPYKVVSRLGGYYDLKYYRNTDVFVANTPDIRRYLIEECGVDAGRVRHINNFTEEEKVEAPVRRSDYGVPEGAVLCLALGRLHENKAFDVLIRSVSDLKDIYVWIAGEGPDRNDLENLISSLSLKNRVQLLGWRSDRAALFEACDICVFPSRFEPFGNVFIQAWAQRVPLITTDSQGPKQFVTHEHDTLVVPVDDVQALAGAIKRLAGDRALGRELVENGARSYLEGFTKEKCVRDYISFFEEILVPEMTN